MQFLKAYFRGGGSDGFANLYINHENIAKGTRDPRVEFKNTDQASISIPTKLEIQNIDQS